ncbi:MAG: hypothetical protein CMB80_26000 [Flammeovirgaceae bacterium]|nr:hypothetical protein [Flammeovirgaceae bacterium]|tara:strand:+ start:8920 stop:9666 length:747 start_codon:yes stop_codon:yes gene_type:complete
MNNDNKIKNALKDYIVSWPVLLLVSVILFITDFILSKPLYTLVLDMPAFGNVLALGMATLFSVLPKVTGKLLTMTQKRHDLIVFAFLLGLGLLSLIYVGQAEVARQETADPLTFYLDPDTAPRHESQQHIIATTLISLLYGFAVWLSVIYYADTRDFKSTGMGLLMSKLWRWFQYRLLLAKGRFERANAKPTITAEGRVTDHLNALEKEARELEKKLTRMEHDYKYELDMHKNARARIILAIEIAYID